MVGRELNRHGARQADHGAFAAVIPRQARARAHAGGRGYVADHAMALPAEDRHAMFGAEKNALHIDRENAVIHRLVDIQHRLARMGYAGIVDDNVERAEFFHGGFDEAREILALRHIGLHRYSRRAARAQSVARAVAMRLVNIGDDNARAMIGEELRDAGAKARACAGDDGGLFLKVHVVS